VARAYFPERGDLVWLEFNPQAGHEQAGHRPAFVVSPRAYHRKIGLALVCPVTSRIRQYPFEVVLPAGCKTRGAILSDQVKSLDWRVRKATFIERVASEVVDEVTARILALVDPE
jgi:mRNA interferase MazF